MVLIITASPNQDGLTAACGRAAKAGVERAGGKAELYDLCTEKISPCRVCGNGWGICRQENRCIIEDCLPDFQKRIAEAESLIIITPVYWQQPSERMKYFCDRIRRCEASKRWKENARSVFEGKKVNLIAAAGGSGNGTATCLCELETWCRHVGGVPHERIGINRFNREPMLKVIEHTSAQLVSSEV